jgi:hypothetical protein
MLLIPNVVFIDHVAHLGKRGIPAEPDRTPHLPACYISPWPKSLALSFQDTPITLLRQRGNRSRETFPGYNDCHAYLDLIAECGA